MKPEPKEMQELHEIRAHLSAEQKGWSTQQVIDYYSREAEKTAREFGIQLKRQHHRQPRRKAG